MFNSFELSGVGLHSGKVTHVKISPAIKGEGIFFIRVDLPNKPIIKADIDQILTTTLSTELGQNNATVRTVEHLLAALNGCGITDASIEIDGLEVPLLDGSAKLWVEAIQASLFSKSEFSEVMREEIIEPIFVRENDAFVGVLPSPYLCFTYGIDFPYSCIGNQWYHWNPLQEDFSLAIANARTFGFEDQIEQLKSMGLIQGGNLENALVCHKDGWVNPPLRFENEPVRHKMLDLIGDLSLLGIIPQGHFIAYKASHNLHTQLAKKIRNNSRKRQN